jgi:hypothetical protein
LTQVERTTGGRAEFCRRCRDEGRGSVAAQFIVWGKLFPREALGPRCYDCMTEQLDHIGHCRSCREQAAIYELPRAVT